MFLNVKGCHICGKKFVPLKLLCASIMFKEREVVVHAVNGSKSQIFIIFTIHIVSAVQHNITTVYISTLIYERDF